MTWWAVVERSCFAMKRGSPQMRRESDDEISNLGSGGCQELQERSQHAIQAALHES